MRPRAERIQGNHAGTPRTRSRTRTFARESSSIRPSGPASGARSAGTARRRQGLKPDRGETRPLAVDGSMRSTKARPQRGDALTTTGILVQQVIGAPSFAVLAILAPAEHPRSRGPPLRHAAPCTRRAKPTFRLADTEALASPHAHGVHPKKGHAGTAKPCRPSPAGCRAAGRSPKSARPRRRAAAVSIASSHGSRANRGPQSP